MSFILFLGLKGEADRQSLRVENYFWTFLYEAAKGTLRGKLPWRSREQTLVAGHQPQRVGGL